MFIDGKFHPVPLPPRPGAPAADGPGFAAASAGPPAVPQDAGVPAPARSRTLIDPASGVVVTVEGNLRTGPVTQRPSPEQIRAYSLTPPASSSVALAL